MQPAVPAGTTSHVRRPSESTYSASADTGTNLRRPCFYLISEQPKIRTTHGRIGQVIDAAFGLNAGQLSTTRDQLRWLFERPNEAVHPYTELEPPRVHPAGLNSSAETAKFNAVESSRAVDIAMAMMELAAAPPNPHGRWVTRWVAEREPYHSTVMAPLRAPGHRPTDAGSDNRHRLTAPRPMGSDVANSICHAPRSNDRCE
jgi:hypothetical protein